MEEHVRMRSQLEGDDVGDCRAKRRSIPAAGGRGAAEQRAVDRRMHGELLENNEHET